MSTHKGTIVRLEGIEVGPDLQMRCRCGRYSPRMGTRQDVEDWHREHVEEMERLRLSMAKSGPSLLDQHAHYTAMASDPTVTESDRLLWQQLADELERRLPTKETPDQLSLDL